MACLYPSAGHSAGLNCNVLLLEPVEEVDLRLAMPLFVEEAGLRMHADKKFIAIRHRVGLDLLAEAFVSAQGTTYHLAAHTAKNVPSFALSIVHIDAGLHTCL